MPRPATHILLSGLRGARGLLGGAAWGVPRRGGHAAPPLSCTEEEGEAEARWACVAKTFSGLCLSAPGSGELGGHQPHPARGSLLQQRRASRAWPPTLSAPLGGPAALNRRECPSPVSCPHPCCLSLAHLLSSRGRGKVPFALTCCPLGVRNEVSLVLEPRFRVKRETPPSPKGSRVLDGNRTSEKEAARRRRGSRRGRRRG